MIENSDTVPAGRVDDYNTIINYAKTCEILRKKGNKGWKFFNLNAKKLDDVKRLMVSKEEFYYKTQMEIIERTKNAIAGQE